MHVIVQNGVTPEYHVSFLVLPITAESIKRYSSTSDFFTVWVPQLQGFMRPLAFIEDDAVAKKLIETLKHIEQSHYATLKWLHQCTKDQIGSVVGSCESLLVLDAISLNPTKPVTDGMSLGSRKMEGLADLFPDMNLSSIGELTNDDIREMLLSKLDHI